MAVAAANAGAMQITIVPGTTLAANSEALAAFQRAADSWDALFGDPIQITVNADLSSAFANPNVIGSTSSMILEAGYNTIRNQLVADSAGQADKAIVGYLPTAAQFSGELPTGYDFSGNIVASKANLKAIGFVGLDSLFGVSDGSITFNSNFNFYYGTGAVPAGQIDFETVAMHELGHLLGFFSTVDEVDSEIHNGTHDAIDIGLLDLYRFSEASLPSTTSEFTNNSRSFVPGVDAFTSDTVVQYEMSTGTYNGDGNQASHWKDDGFTSVHIGVMDPTIAYGATSGITSADIRAMELIGYDLAVPEPATAALMIGALGALIAMGRRKRSANS